MSIREIGYLNQLLKYLRRARRCIHDGGLDVLSEEDLDEMIQEVEEEKARTREVL